MDDKFYIDKDNAGKQDFYAEEDSAQRQTDSRNQFGICYII
jgi:hypothetical protein